MKRRIPTLLLLISPYLFFIISSINSNKLSEEESDNFFFLLFGALILIFLFNMVYPFVLAWRGEKASSLLFWDMILKLFNIPIYLANFFFGTFSALLPLGFVLTIIFVIFDYALLLPSTMYGVSGLIQAWREKKISLASAVFNSILHFIFCLDVISAIVMYIKVKIRSKKKNPEQDGLMI
jgi:ABC-type multidrug transport system fused ATPase/permease subunit